MLQLYISSYSKKFLKKNQGANPKATKKIAIAISNLQKEPLPVGYKKLTGYRFYRIRIGGYRIVYDYNDQNLYILAIESRDKIYNVIKKIRHIA